MSLKTDYEKAMTNLLITYGSVALPPDPHERSDNGRDFSTGSYYHSSVEADVKATRAFYERLSKGARPIYDQCGPSDFGQAYRFDHTFTETQLEVKYAMMRVVLDDSPTPVILIAAVEDNSFSSMLHWVINQDVDDVETAIIKMGERCTDPTDKWDYKLQCPKIK